jgi:hypothetical protein
MDVAEKYGCAVFGTTVSLVLAFLPLLHYLKTGNFEDTIKLWDSFGVEVGLGNGIVWLLYSIVVLKRDSCLDSVLAYSCICTSNLCYLLLICGYRREIRKVTAEYYENGHGIPSIRF